MTHRYYLIVVLSLLYLTQIFAQSSDTIPDVSTPSKRHYLTFSLGYNSLIYRDFATSPLFYSGGSAVFGLGYEVASDRLYSSVDIHLATTSFNTLSLSIFEVKSERPPYVQSDVVRANFRYSRLYRISPPSAKFNLKLGGMLDAMYLYRLNNGLNNNSLGIEVFPTLFASMRARYQFLRHSNNFISRLLIPRRSSLSFTLNLPIVYTNYRKANYIYTSDAGIRDRPTTNLYNAFKYYNGFRLGTVTDYDIVVGTRNIGNKIRLSYQWNIYETSNGGSPEKFEYADHTFLLTFLFNID